MKGVALRIEDSAGAPLWLATTGAEGTFAFEKVTPGEYRLVVVDKGELMVKVTKDAKGKSLTLIVPESNGYSAGALGGGGLGAVIGIAAIVGVTTAVIIAAADDDDAS